MENREWRMPALTEPAQLTSLEALGVAIKAEIEVAKLEETL